MPQEGRVREGTQCDKTVFLICNSVHKMDQHKNATESSFNIPEMSVIGTEIKVNFTPTWLNFNAKYPLKSSYPVLFQPSALPSPSLNQTLTKLIKFELISQTVSKQ